MTIKRTSIQQKGIAKTALLLLLCCLSLQSLTAQTTICNSTYLATNAASGHTIMHNDMTYTFFAQLNPGFEPLPGAFQSVNGGNDDAGILVMGTDGQPVWSTFIGGAQDESVSNGIDVMTIVDDYLYVAFQTRSFSISGFDGSNPSYRTSIAVAKFDASNGAFIWGKILAGSGTNFVGGISVANDRVFLTGTTYSDDFPVTADAAETQNVDERGAYIVELDATDGSMTYASYFGASNEDVRIFRQTLQGNTLAVVGWTDVGGVSLTSNAAISDAGTEESQLYLAYIDIDTRQTTYATYLNTVSGTNGDAGSIADFATDGERIYVSIYHHEGDSPPIAGGGIDYPESDGFVSIYNLTSGALEFSTEVGIGNSDYGSSIVVNPVAGKWALFGVGPEQNFTPVKPLMIPTAVENSAFFQVFDIGTNQVFQATYIGDDEAYNLVSELNFDDKGHIFIAGVGVNIEDYGLITDDALESTKNGSGSFTNDAYILKVGLKGELLYGTYMTSFFNSASGLDFNFRSDDVVVLTLRTPSNNDFPITEGAYSDGTTGTSPTAQDMGMVQFDCCPDLLGDNTITSSQTVCNLGRTTGISGGDLIVDPTNFPNLLKSGNILTQQAAVKYRWEVSVNQVDWETVPGATLRDFLPPPTDVDVYYRRIAGSSICDDNVSNIHHVQVNGTQAPTLMDGTTDICPSTNVVIGSLATGGTGSYTYQWSPATSLSASNIAQPTFNGSVSALYNVVVTDTGTGCEFEENWQASVYSANAGPDQDFCIGEGGLIGTEGIVGGNFSYAWTSVSGDPISSLNDANTAQPLANPTNNSTYQLEMTINSAGCSSTDNVNVTINTSVANAGSDLVLCKGEEVVLGGETADADYTYAWAPGLYIDNQNIAQPTFKSALCPATNPLVYTLTKIHNASGCVDVDEIEISILHLDLFNNYCGPATIGEREEACGLNLAGTTFTWSVVSGDAGSLAAGEVNSEFPTVNPSTLTVYQLDVCLNGKCCSDQVVVDPDCSGIGCGVDIEAISDIVCPVGGQFGTTLKGTLDYGGNNNALPTGYSFAWSPTTGLADPNSLTTAVNALISDQTYTLSVILDADGTVICSDDITVYAAPVANPIIGVSDKVFCPTNNTPIEIGVPEVAGWSYVWTPATNLDDPNIANPSATLTESASYDVTATDDVTGCAYTATVNVQSRAPVANAGTDSPFCENAIIQLGTTAQPNMSYSWSPAAGLTEPNSAQPLDTIFTTVTYTLVVTDNETGCSDTDDVTYTLTTPPTYDAPDVVTCDGGSVQIGLAAQAGYSYNWIPATGLSATNVAQPFATITENTTYTVFVSDGNPGCYASDQVAVTIGSVASLDASDVSVCNGVSIDIGVTNAGGTYAWSPTTGLGSPTAATTSVVATETTTYILTWTTPGGCMISDEVVVTVIEPPSLIVSDQTICEGENVPIGPANDNDLTYSWTSISGDPVGTLSSSTVARPTATPTQTTVYRVTATSGAGCNSIADVTVTVNTSPAISLGLDQTGCDNIPLSVTINSGTVDTYQWSTTATTSSISVSPTLATTYSVTVTAPNGCEASDEVLVSPNVTVDAGADKSVCAGAGVQIGTASIAGHTYSWSPSTGLSNTNIAQPIAMTSIDRTYTLTVSSGGCSKTDDITVSVSSNPTMDLGADQVVCVNSCITIGTPFETGHFYEWTPTTGLSDGFSNEVSVCPTADVTYELFVTNSAGCVSSEKINLTMSTAPIPVVNAGSDATICSGESITLGETATAGLTYAWSPGTGLNNQYISNPTLQINNTTGAPETYTYIVSATDNATFCMAMDTVVVIVNPFPQISGADDVTICNGNTYKADITLSPSSSNYVYSWTPVSAVEDATIEDVVLTPNSTTLYTVTAQDTVTMCTAITSFIVTVATETLIADAGPDIERCDGTPTSAQVGTPAVAGASYLWTRNGGTALSSGYIDAGTATDAQPTLFYYAGTYELTVTGASGCIATDEITFLNNSSTAYTLDAGLDTIICSTNYQLESLESFPQFTTGAWEQTTGPNQAVFSDSTEQNPTISGLAAGNYTFKRTIYGAICGGEKSDFVNITVGATPTLVLATPACVPVDLTAASFTAGSSNLGTFSYWIDSTATVPIPAPTAVADAGTYYIKNTTTEGCAVTEAVTLATCAICVTIDSITADKSICSGVVVDTIAVTTTLTNPDSIAFVYFTTPQTDNSLIYTNGIGIDTVHVTMGNDTVQIVDVNGFTNAEITPDTFYVYGIAHPAPADPTCRPYDEILVIVNACDWGDLPDISSNTATDDYQTSSNNNGPSHIIIPDLSLGIAIDGETDGQQSPDALGDGVDEDAITIYPSLDLYPGITFRLPFAYTNSTGNTAHIEAWMDWNGDGDFDELDEMVIDWNDGSGALPNIMEITVPTTAITGTSLGLRVRISNQDVMTPYGEQPNGEVEDYLISIGCPQICIPIQAMIIRN